MPRQPTTPRGVRRAFNRLPWPTPAFKKGYEASCAGKHKGQTPFTGAEAVEWRRGWEARYYGDEPQTWSAQ
jgi:ribosome modulation factor